MSVNDAAPAAQPDGKTVIQKLEAFLLAVATRQHAHAEQVVPQLKLVENVDNGVLTVEIKGDKVILDWVPNA